MSEEESNFYIKQIEKASTSPDMSTLYKTFNELYEQRMLAIENNENLDNNTKNQEKLMLLQQHVHLLQEQNDTFLSVMTELETEAQKRVSQMDQRLKTSAKTTMEAAVNIHECGNEMRRLVDERLLIESLFQEMQQQLSAVKVENGFLRDQNFNLSHDVQSLLHVIHQARSTGHWEMDCITFCDVTPEQVFGPIQSISTNTAELFYDHHNTERTFPANPAALSEDIWIQTDHKVHNIPGKLLSSEASLPKYISLPDIGNIYHFSNCLRKSQSYSKFERTNTSNLPKINFCSKTTNREDNESEVQKCMTKNKKNRVSCVRRSQSEPYLFMFGDSIYVYRPCEPIEKASDDLLQIDLEMSLPPCQSIDLKFPTEEPNAKLCDWTTLRREESYNAINTNYFKEDATTSSCTYSDPEDNSFAKSEVPKVNKSSSCAQTEVPNLCQLSSFTQTEEYTTADSIGIQASLNKVNGGCTEANEAYLIDSFATNSTIDILKVNLMKAENKVEAKEILIEKLQGHLTSAIKEVELKDTALSNLEKKLDCSRKEVICLNNRIEALNSNISGLLKKIDNLQVMNDNLKNEAEGKENKIVELMSQITMLQNQKCTLMVQLDTQGDEFEKLKEELVAARSKTESSILQISQQGQIIRSLQDALVQAKRAYDATHQNHHTGSSKSLEEVKSPSKSSIVNI